MSMIALKMSGVGSAGSTGWDARSPVHQFRTNCFLRALVVPFATRFQMGCSRCVSCGCKLPIAHSLAMSSSGSPLGCCCAYNPPAWWTWGSWKPTWFCCCGRSGRCASPGNVRSWSMRCQSASVMPVLMCLLRIAYICVMAGIVGWVWGASW